MNVGLQLRKEWNHNGDLGMKESYDVNFNVSPVWHFPFTLGGARLAFDGFADYNTAKGQDVAGHDTKPEFITRPQLKLDVSRIVGQKAGVLELGVGFQVPGTTCSARTRIAFRGPRSSRPSSPWPCTCR